MEPAPQHTRSPGPSAVVPVVPVPVSGWIAFVAALLLVLAMCFATDTTFTGDTYYYVSDIHKVLNEERPAVALFEFGHLLWRPAGYYLTQGLYGAMADQSVHAQRARITGVLKSLSLLATVACTAFLWLLMTQVVGVGGTRHSSHALHS